MARDKRALVRWLLLGAAAVLLACAAGSVLLTQTAASQRAYEQARIRWAARPFGDYHLVAQDEHCTYDVLVRRGQVNAGFSDGCHFSARAIDALFAIIERDREVSAVCGTHGCLCEMVTRVQAAYHPRLGYPTQIRVGVEMRPSWSNPDVWRALLGTGRPPLCGSGSGRTISVLTVEPLQR